MYVLYIRTWHRSVSPTRANGLKEIILVVQNNFWIHDVYEIIHFQHISFENRLTYTVCWTVTEDMSALHVNTLKWIWWLGGLLLSIVNWCFVTKLYRRGHDDLGDHYFECGDLKLVVLFKRVKLYVVVSNTESNLMLHCMWNWNSSWLVTMMVMYKLSQKCCILQMN